MPCWAYLKTNFEYLCLSRFTTFNQHVHQISSWIESHDFRTTFILTSKNHKYAKVVEEMLQNDSSPKWWNTGMWMGGFQVIIWWCNVFVRNDSSRNMPHGKKVWCKQREWKLAKTSAEKSLRRNTGNLEIDHFQARVS